MLLLLHDEIFMNPCAQAARPKGTPIPIDSVNISTMDENPKAFIVSTIRKTVYVVVQSSTERDEWITAIRQARQLVRCRSLQVLGLDSQHTHDICMHAAQIIKQQLGHAPSDKHATRSNRIGEDMYKRRLRHDERQAVNKGTPIT